MQNPRTDIVNEFIDFPDDNETELQSLLNQLSTESVTVQEYVNLENSVQFNDTCERRFDQVTSAALNRVAR